MMVAKQSALKWDEALFWLHQKMWAGLFVRSMLTAF